MSPSLSIVIPTFRRDASLGRLLNALRQQSVRELEIIVVDQNPPGFLAHHVGPAIEALSVVRLEQPNVSTARNVGFLASRAPYVLFIDDDLIPNREFCARAMERLTSHRDVRCLVPIVVTDSGPQEVARTNYLPKRRSIHPRELDLWEIEWTLSAAVFFERRCYEESGGFDELLFQFAGAAEDQEIFLRMRARGLTLWADAGLTVFHDESVAGGCEMRSADYWRTRQKCMRSWAFRERTHAARPGRLTSPALLRMARSALLNRNLLRMSLDDMQRNARLLVEAIGESERFVAEHLTSYSGVRVVDHLARHRLSSDRDNAGARSSS